jgi:predicted metal-dependent hydrolase
VHQRAKQAWRSLAQLSHQVTSASPTGRVRISAPLHMSVDNIRIFAIAKLGWIKKEQQKMREQERETQRDYVDRESHYVWGKRCLMKVVELEAPPCVSLKHKTLTLQVRPNTDLVKRQEMVAQWYRNLIKEATPPLISKWEPTRLPETFD